MLPVILGAAFIVTSAILALRPGVTRWLSDKLNRDRFGLETGGDAAMRKYEFNVRVLQVFIPVTLAIAGVAFIVRGLGG